MGLETLRKTFPTKVGCLLVPVSKRSAWLPPSTPVSYENGIAASHAWLPPVSPSRAEIGTHVKKSLFAAPLTRSRRLLGVIWQMLLACLTLLVCLGHVLCVSRRFLRLLRCLWIVNGLFILCCIIMRRLNLRLPQMLLLSAVLSLWFGRVICVVSVWKRLLVLP